MGDPRYDFVVELTGVYSEGQISHLVVRLLDDWDRPRFITTLERGRHQTLQQLLAAGAAQCGRHMLAHPV